MGDLKHDIEKYLQGELSPSEMHALEKRALNDPFLADALEGVSHITANDFVHDQELLEKNLQERIEPQQKTRTLWYWPLRIAAGLLMIMATGYIIFQWSDQKHIPVTLALNKPAPKPEAASPIVADTIQSAPPSDVSSKIRHSKKMSDGTPIIDIEPVAASEPDNLASGVQAESEVVAEIEKEPAEILAKSAPSKMEQQQPVVTSDDVAENKKMKEQPLQASAMSRADLKTSATRIVRGKVIDAEDGSGMPGVNVVIKGTDKGTVTNAEGYFQLPVKDAPNEELQFSFVGMQNQEVPIPATDSVNVQLSPDYASLSEVVVVGYAPADGVVKEGENTYELAAPEGGRKEFKTYLVTSMKYPQIAIENKIEGRVTVQFTVDTSGLLYDFRIVKGIGFGCDQEVIRLIKEGPKWTPTKRNSVPLKNKVKVKLRFKLPQ